jgi:hypothetical protein
MRSVTIRLSGSAFSTTMATISEWLDANRCEPTRYKYEDHEDDVLVTVVFPTEAAAQAFAMRFEGVYHSSTELGSPDSSRQLPT